jgi:hypothetical protein
VGGDALYDGLGPCPAVDGPRVQSNQDQLELGLTAGTGLTLALGRVKPFIELRYFASDDRQPAGASLSGRIPTVIGVRF